MGGGGWTPLAPQAAAQQGGASGSCAVSTQAEAAEEDAQQSRGPLGISGTGRDWVQGVELGANGKLPEGRTDGGTERGRGEGEAQERGESSRRNLLGLGGEWGTVSWRWRKGGARGTPEPGGLEGTQAGARGREGESRGSWGRSGKGC